MVLISLDMKKTVLSANDAEERINAAIIYTLSFTAL